MRGDPNGARAKRRAAALERARERLAAPHALLSIPEVAALWGRSPDGTRALLMSRNMDLDGALLRNVSSNPARPRWIVAASALKAILPEAIEARGELLDSLEEREEAMAELGARLAVHERLLRAIVERMIG